MRRRRFGRRKPPMQWCSSTTYGFDTALAGGVNNFELCGASPSTSFDPPVIDRFTAVTVRGQIVIHPSTANTSTELRLGIIVVRRSSATAAAMPDPAVSNDADQPWLWLESYRQDAFAVGAQVETQVSVIQVHAKVQRVLRQGDQLQLIINRVALVGTSPAVNMTHYLRTLIKRVA